MRSSSRVWCLTLILFSCAPVSFGQTTPPARHAPVTRKYCQPDDGFCFKYPASWMVLGEIFKGNGVVVAPSQKQDRTLWNAITVALVVPAPEGDEDAVTLDGAIEQATAGLREAGQDFETLQRQTRMVDKKPAEVLKVRYHEKVNQADWVEELVFIQGPDNEIYSVGLKSSPADLVRMEAAFAGVLASWTLPERVPTPSANPAPGTPAPTQSEPRPNTPQQTPGKTAPASTPPAEPAP